MKQSDFLQTALYLKMRIVHAYVSRSMHARMQREFNCRRPRYKLDHDKIFTVQAEWCRSTQCTVKSECYQSISHAWFKPLNQFCPCTQLGYTGVLERFTFMRDTQLRWRHIYMYGVLRALYRCFQAGKAMSSFWKKKEYQGIQREKTKKTLIDITSKFSLQLHSAQKWLFKSIKAPCSVTILYKISIYFAPTNRINLTTEALLPVARELCE